MNSTRTPLFLMANLGSEVARFVGSTSKGDTALAHAALKRARRIVADIRMIPEMKGRRDEVNILADVLSDFEREERKYSVTPDALKRYFEPFVLRVHAT